MSEKRPSHRRPADIDAVIEAGEILMECGAEIYRIEDTMRHIASSLGIEHFEASVANREIIVSGTNSRGIQEAKVASVPEVVVHLDKIEAVNALSREIKQRSNIQPQAVMARLRRIREMPEPPLKAKLLAYFLGAGGFSYAIGSTLQDSIGSAVIGLVMGLVLQWAGNRIQTNVLLTMLGSAVVTLLANVFSIYGLVENRGAIVLGTLMLLVPGAIFTNSVREFSMNNHITGLTMLMSSLLTCLSIAAGIVFVTDLFLFVEPITQGFITDVTTLRDVPACMVMAGIGTVAFSFLFHAPKRYFWDLGILGAVSWMLYLLVDIYFEVEFTSIFVPALFAALSSRYLSVRRKCPASIFLSTSIFPLIPGLTFFRAVYFLMIGTPALAWTSLRSCFISAFAIAIAIMIMQEFGRQSMMKKA